MAFITAMQTARDKAARNEGRYPAFNA